jgi:hypothetical protein
MHDAHNSPGIAHMLKRLSALALLVMLPSIALADAAVEKAVVAQTLDTFEHEATVVREGMEPGGVYSFMKDDDRKRVEQQLEAMHKLLQDHAAQDKLSAQDKISLLNSQEALNALLLQNDNNRLICERGTRTGSRIHVTTCRTHGEIMQREQNDRQLLGDIQKQPQNQKPAGN